MHTLRILSTEKRKRNEKSEWSKAKRNEEVMEWKMDFRKGYLKYKRKGDIWIKWRNDERKIQNIWNKKTNYYNKKKIEKEYSEHYNERENNERKNAILIKGKLKEKKKTNVNNQRK